APPPLHPFPTRRSSDLGACLLGLYAGTGPREVDDPRLIQMVQALVDWFREEVGQQYGDTTCKAIVEGNFNNAPSRCPGIVAKTRSEEHTSELQSRENLV